MDLIIDGQYEPELEEVEQLKKCLSICLEQEGVKNQEVELSIIFISEEEIQEINAEHRGIDKVTDVLSFPQFETPLDIPEEGICILGDVVICVDVAQKQALEFGHSFKRELMYLYVHSLFHLLGHDHMEEEEKKVMRAAEELVMTKIGIGR